MPEPTDHRAEAERFVLSAVDSWANADTGNEDEVRTRLGYAISEALIGIGHALLAGLLEPAIEPPEWATATLTNTDEPTVEIGGQTMTEAQFNAARYPLLNPNPGPAEQPAATSSVE